MKKVSMVIALILVIAMVLGFLAMIPSVIAAEELTVSYGLSELLSSGAVKPMGRTQVGGAGIRTDWSGTGFAATVTVPEEGILEIGYVSSYHTYWAVRLDGQAHWRGYAASNTSGGTFSCRLPAGTHTVEVIKETEISSNQAAYCDLTDVTVPAGTVIEHPGDQELYIEFIGDSYACGDGALGTYQAGAAWTTADHSATNGFSFYTAQALNADWSIVARGGIGLLGDDAQQADTANVLTIDQIYGLASGYRDISAGTAWSGRTPDVIVMELGANDGTGDMDTWKQKLNAFFGQVRAKHPNTPIVFFAKNTLHYFAVQELIDAGAYDHLYATCFNFGGAGSAAVKTQKAGHPSAQEHQYIAQELVKFLEQTVLKDTADAQEAQTYQYHYYVSQTGDDSNDGLTEETAKLTLNDAMAQARKDHSTAGSATGYVFAEEGISFCFNVTGTVSAGTGQALAGTAQRYCDARGNDIPVLIRAYGDNTATEGRAVVQNDYQPSNNGSSVLPIYFSAVFENIELSTLTNETTGYAPYTLRMGGNDVVLDNVKFSIRGSKSTTQFQLSAAPFIPGGGNLATRLEQGEVTSCLTLRNGDYSSYRVSCVMGNSLWTSTGNIYEMYGLHTKIIVDQGAILGTIRNLEGTFSVGSSTVEVRDGGYVNLYLGTNNGKADALLTYNTKQLCLNVLGGQVNEVYGVHMYSVLPECQVYNRISGGKVGLFNGTHQRATLTQGSVHNIITGGLITGAHFLAVGNNSVIGGDVINTVSGGRIHVELEATLTSSNNAMGIFLGGGTGLDIQGNVINEISGGALIVTINTDLSTSSLKIDQGMYFGIKGGTVQGSLINNISGGGFYLEKKGSGGITATGIYLGNYGGTVLGNLENNIGAGIFDSTNAGYPYYLGGRGLSNYVGGQIRNVIGVAGEPQNGPVFVGGVNLYLGGGWGRLNYDASVADGNEKASMPADAVITQTVISNTIYGGRFTGSTYCGVGGNSKGNGGSNYVSYIYGSVENAIYGGRFETNLYLGGGGTNVYGNVTSNIYGGIYQNIIGGAGYGVIRGDVTTNICGMEEYAPIGNTSAGYKLVAGSYSTSATYMPGAIYGTLSLNICPEDYRQLTLSTPIYDYSLGGTAGNGTVAVNNGLTVSAGSFPEGLTVNGGAVTQEQIPDTSIACGTDGVAVSDLSETLSVRAVGQEAHSIFHCVCGNLTAQSLTGAVSGDPEDCLGADNGGCDGKILEWLPWENTDKLPNTKALLGDGAEHNFYLVNDVRLTAQASLGSGAITQETTYRLDLNGKTVCHQVDPTRVASGDGYRVLVTFGSGATSTYDLNLVVTDSSPDKTGLVTIRNVPNGEAVKNYGQLIWARFGDVDIYGGTFDGSNENHDGAYAYVDGAAVQINSGNTVNMYGGRLIGGECFVPGKNLSGGGILVRGGGTLNLYENAVIEGGCADFGGGVCVQENGSFNMYGGTVQNGTARDNGGNICLYKGGTLNVQGGAVRGGTAGDSGGNLVIYGQMTMTDGTVEEGSARAGKAQNVFLVDNASNDGALIMTGGTIAGDLGIVGDAATVIKLAGDVQIPCGQVYGISLPDHVILDLTEGLAQTAAVSVRKYNGGVFTTENAQVYKDRFATNLEEHVIAVGQSGVLSLGTPESFTALGINGTVEYYESLTLAASLNQGKTVQLQGDITEDVALTGKLVLDLNGYTLTGDVTGGQLWGMDSTTDDYQAETYGRITGTIENLANAQGEKFTVPGTELIRRYIGIPEESGTSFHRIYLGITSMSLRPDTVSFGYKAQFWADQAVQERITGIGYELWAGEDGTLLTRTVPMEQNGETLTLRVSNVLKENGTYNDLALTTPVHARTVMTFSVEGETFTVSTGEQAYTLQDMLLRLDETFAQLTQAQCIAIKEMYMRFESLMAGLELPNIAAYVTPEA